MAWIVQQPHQVQVHSNDLQGSIKRCSYISAMASRQKIIAPRDALCRVTSALRSLKVSNSIIVQNKRRLAVMCMQAYGNRKYQISSSRNAYPILMSCECFCHNAGNTWLGVPI